jgi:GTPase
MDFLADDPRPPSPFTHQGLLCNFEHLTEEVDDGSVEYKLKLVGVSDNRLQHLITQMKFRVAEGNGECLYELGVANCGLAVGLPKVEFDETLQTIRRMAASLKFEVTILHERITSKEPLMRCAEVLVRKGVSPTVSEVRMAMCGAIDAGKSTLIGVLTEGCLDDGHGAARQSVFTHKHELQSGHTSAISAKFLGFDAKGRMVDLDADEKANKIVALYDMAGSERYLSSTVSGFSAWEPDVGCVVVSATAGVQKMTREQTALCGAFKIPWMVVVTKVDLANGARLSQTLQEVDAFVRSHPGLEPCILDEDEVPTWEEGIVSVVLTSCVSGQGLDIVYALMRTAPPHHDWSKQRELPTHVTLAQCRTVNDVGLVFLGLVSQGTLRVHDTLHFGPTVEGKYQTVKVRSLHVKGFHVRDASAGSEVSIALEGEVTDFRHGAVLTAAHSQASWRFTAELFVLRPASFRVSSQPIIHCKGIRQCAAVTSVQKHEGADESGPVTAEFTFMYRPECMQPGSRVTVMMCGVAAIGTVLSYSETASA